MSTHLPIRALRPLQQQCLFRRVESRPFSTTLARPATRRKRSVDPAQTIAAVRYQIQGAKASSVVYDEQLKDDNNLPDDIGLLPGTFIRKPIFPHGLSLSSIARHISSRTYQLDPSRAAGTNTWFYQKLWARLMYDAKYRIAKVKGLILLARFKYVIDKCPPLHWWSRSAVKNVARDKYVYMYRSFASGDSRAISEMCLSGVAKGFQDRIAARPRGLAAKWKLEGKRDVATSLVSNRALLLSLPGYDDTGIQQIVVRMRSNQSLRFDATAKESQDKTLRYSPKEGEVLEYLVLQRQIMRGVFKEWKVWGFANEWDVETIAEDAQLERELNAFQGSQAA